MFVGSLHLWDVKKLVACAAVLLLVLAASAKAYASVQWQRYEDTETGLSVRYPSYWGRDTREHEHDPELIATFLAPITNRSMTSEPATVELRVIRTHSTEEANVRGLADGFQQYYKDRPHVYRIFQRKDIEIKGVPAVQFSYNLLADDETRYVIETWQPMGDMAVSLRFSTYAQTNHREDHYRDIYSDMISSLVRLHDRNTLAPTDNLRPLGGRTPIWAAPRRRSNIVDHSLPRMFTTEGGLTVSFPEEWEAQPIFANYISESVYFSGTRRNDLPITVTSTDLYIVFIGGAEEFTDRNYLMQQGDDFWLETVTTAQIANYKQLVPSFELIHRRETSVNGKLAVQLEYKGVIGEESTTRREILLVDDLVLYSFVYELGTTTTSTFEKMVDAVVLP
jgi:hypothetical protein